MDIIRSWIMTVTVSAMIIAVAEVLMPKGAVKTVGKLTGGLVLMLGILQPLLSLDYEQMLLELGDLSTDSVAIGQAQGVAQNNLLVGIIESELSAYVLDKAQSLGYSCEVQIVCRLGENNVPYPVQAQLTGLTSAQQETMAAFLEVELGLTRDRQVYIE